MRYSLSLALAVEMCNLPKAALSTVTCTPTSAIIMVQFAECVPEALSYDPPTTIVVSEPLEAGVLAFTNLFTRFKMEYLPAGDIDANICFLHQSESSP